PKELKLLLFRGEEAPIAVAGAVAARRIRDEVDAFRACVREDIQGNRVTVAREPDHMNSIAILVGYPNSAAVGRPERERRYSWPFKRVMLDIGGKEVRDVCDSSIPMNPKDIAFLAGDDHVETICANMVEGNPVVVRCDAPREGRKQRDIAIRDL